MNDCTLHNYGKHVQSLVRRDDAWDKDVISEMQMSILKG